MINRIRGTQDLLDLTLYNYIIKTAHAHLAEYNFHEISTPILEPTELFKRSLGLETDVVSKEMYTVKTETGDDQICLRPEATASIARAFNNNAIDQTPWKVYLHGPMFRHERPQKGRYRQFHQLDVEIIGSTAIEQDAYLIKMLDRFFNVKLNLNNYALKLNYLGCPQDRAAYHDILKDFLNSLGDQLCTTCIKRKNSNIMRVFDCKNETCQILYKNAPFIAEHLCNQCDTEWKKLKELLMQLSVSYSYTPNLVRGLDYYNKTVFEFVSMQLGAQDAFAGGGRYDHLIKEVGDKKDQPSIGAAIGIERLMLLLEDQKDAIYARTKKPLSLIIPVAQEQKPLALLLADSLQHEGIQTDILLEGSLKSMMRKANKMGADFVCILGQEEQEARTITVKIMKTGKEIKDVPHVELAALIQQNPE